MISTVYLYVFDTMADWEIGFLTAELNSGRYFMKGLPPTKIVTLGAEKIPVTTMGLAQNGLLDSRWHTSND